MLHPQCRGEEIGDRHEDFSCSSLRRCAGAALRANRFPTSPSIPRPICSRCPSTSTWAKRPAWPPTRRATSSSTRARAARTPPWADRASSRTAASRLFEFDRNGKFVREIGKGVYGFLFAQAVQVDPQDNIWVVDRGSSMVIKFDPEGRILMTMGRKPEAVAEPGRGGRSAAGRGGRPAPVAVDPVVDPDEDAVRRAQASPGDNFNRPTDVAWDAAGNIFVADGYGNARIAKFDKNGKFVKSWGSQRHRTRASSTRRIRSPPMRRATSTSPITATSASRFFDNDGKFKTQIAERRRSLGASALLRARISISTARIRTTPTRWTTARSTRWNWTAASSANSAGPGSSRRSSAR